MVYILTKDNERFGKLTGDYTLTDNADLCLSGMPDKVGFDSEGSGRAFMKDNLVSMQLAWDNRVVIVDCTSFPVNVIAPYIKERTLVIHHALNDLPFLYKGGVWPDEVYCTYIAEKILSMGQPWAFGIEDLSAKYGFGGIDKTNKGRINYEVDDAAIEYCINDVSPLLGIMDKQLSQASRNRQVNAIKLECKFVQILSFFSFCGVRLDEERWNKVMDFNNGLIDEALARLDDFVYTNFPNDKKLCKIDMQGDLFDGFRQTKTCLVKWNYDQSISMLMQKCDNNQNTELSSLISEYRKQVGISRSYGKAYIGFIACDGRIHPKYNQIGPTGRISCPKTGLSSKGYEMPFPSFMEMPKEGPYRSAVIPDEGNIFISADWSAHEVMIAAYLSGDKNLMKATEGNNPHDGMFGFVMDELKKKPYYNTLYEQRKRINLMFINAVSVYGLAQSTGITKEQADEVLTKYQKSYPGVVNMQLKKAYKDGMETICMDSSYGYYLHVKDSENMQKACKLYNSVGMKKYYWKNKGNKSDPFIKEIDWYLDQCKKAVKLSISGAYQCKGAVMFKIACRIFFKEITKREWQDAVKMVIPQHDSITVECPESMKEEVKEILLHSMEKANNMVTPGVHINIKTWEGYEYR